MPPVVLMSRILKSYLKRLTNLSSRNKSLLLTRLVSEQFADLHDTDFLLNASSFDILRQVIERRSRIVLCDVSDPRYEKVNLFSKTLRKIARTEAFISEERGSRDLFVGYPFIRGKFNNGAVIHAPLLFFPVTLGIDNGQWRLTCRSDVGVQLNRTFALAYAQFNETRIPDAVLETPFEEFPLNASIFRTELYKWLKESPFRLDFNRDIFTDKLTPFQALKSADLELLEKTGELKLYPEAVLGIFPQSGSYLEPDYHFLIGGHPGDIGGLLKGDQAHDPLPFHDPSPAEVSLKEERLLIPFASDLSQEQAIGLVKQGASLVVQGPPGSGKSQLICNLMADYAANGKSVLLVCQKRAALDVVYQRLRESGLADFAAVIHDHKNDRGNLYGQIAAQIGHADTYRKDNYSLDAVFLEREFYRESRQIDRLVSDLNAFRTALFDAGEAGVSVKELYLTSEYGAQTIPLNDVLKSFPLDKAMALLPKLRGFLSYRLHIPPTHSWYRRRDFSAFNQADYRCMRDLVSNWPDFFATHRQAFAEITGVPFDMRYARESAAVAESLPAITRMLDDTVVFDLFKKYLQGRENTDARITLAQEAVQALKTWRGIETSLLPDQLSGFRGKLQKTLRAKASPITGLWWEWFGSDRHELRLILGRNTLTTHPEDLRVLDQWLRHRITLEGWLRNEQLHFEHTLLPTGTDFTARHLAFFEKSLQASGVLKRLEGNPWGPLLLKMAGETGNRNHYLGKLASLHQWIRTWEQSAEELEKWLLPGQIEQLCETPEAFSAMLVSDLDKDFENMADMDASWQDFSGEEQTVTERLCNLGTALGLKSTEAFEKLFDNSIRLAWISHIEQKYPVLRAVTSLKMNQWEESLRQRITRKQALSGDIVRMRLKEKVYEDIEKNRLGHSVTYRELRHQVTKKRQIWPIRKIMTHFGDEVFRLVPCWMASPEAVSAVFPMTAALFDLVIFDEASQCATEYGLPAAYRGKQLVVAGDSRQLPPSDLYKIRYEERFDEEDKVPVALEVESLLDLASQTLPSAQLTGHYRSLSLDLIQFSNTFFYGDSLRLLPDFAHINKMEPGISFHKVDGTWEKGVNKVEALKVAELVSSLAADGHSIGVVTFNYPQQQLIETTLEEAGITAPGLFVKNIENVQGDERDIIIFSVGYAPDIQGNLAMQFGSLNVKGGENRLNVAVTRAREKIHMVTSLWPAQLKTEQSAHQGPRLLKAYLAYAQTVSEGRYQPTPAPGGQYKSQWLLKDQLLNKIPDAALELPFADLTLKADKGYRGLILTDDELYFQSSSPKEPHAYLPMLLKQKKWPFKRIFSRAYWTGQEPV